jgi:Ni,Fe-hydrogenase I cytochrome b subunit
LAIITLVLNIQKWVVIIATSILGSATVFGTILLMFNPAAQLLENPIRTLLSSSTLMTIMFIVVAGLGMYFQFASTRTVTVVEYNRMNETGV